MIEGGVENQMSTGRFGKLTYFPGCSLATSAKENNQSLNKFCGQFGIELLELDDWNCCGSSSAHSIDTGLAMDLPARNLFLAPGDRPLLAPCPSCFLRLRHAHLHLKENEAKRGSYENLFGKPFNPDLQIMNFFELLETMNKDGAFNDSVRNLDGLKFASYYGCMLTRPISDVPRRRSTPRGRWCGRCNRRPPASCRRWSCRPIESSRPTSW